MKKLFKSKTFLSAVLSIALCISLIAGATFAIFTSEANVNIAVTSGTVKVTATIGDLTTYSGVNISGTEDDVIAETAEKGKFTNGGTAEKDGNTIKITAMTAGDKVTFPVTIKNESNVNVKYRMRISIADDTGLASELNIKIGDYSGRYVTIWEDLEPGKGDRTLECEIALPTTSTAQGESCTISLLAEAVQGNAAVSNDEHYPVDTASFNEALKYGGNVLVERNIEAEDVLVSESTATIDMNEKTVANTKDIWNNDNDAWSLLSARGEGVELTVDGNGKFLAKADDCYAVDVQDGANLIIKNGTFIGNIHAVYVYKGTLTVEGGFFAIQQTYYPDASKAYEFVLNCYDENRKNGTASIVVKGGTFVNFNPADCLAEGEHTNFLEKGYSVISETQTNGDIWYTVVKGTGAAVTTTEEVADTIKNAPENTSVTVKLAKEGTYTLPSQNVDNKDITIIGTKDTVIDLKTGFAAHGSTISLEGVTVQGQTSGDFQGLQHTAKVVYKNCVITGKQTLYANEVEFIGCKFSSGTDYALWTYGAKNVTFTDCEFESGDNSKAVLCYSVLKDQTFTRTFNNCKFTATGTADKSAIMINPTESSGGTNTYIVNINNCTATGYAENGIAGYTIVGLRNAGAGVIDTITVNIDGATVYTH